MFSYWWLRRKLDWFNYNLSQGLRNLWAYLPLIWKQRDWDWAYLADLMEFKLRRMNKLFLKQGNHVGSEKAARRMLVCAELIKRLREDKYRYRLPFGGEPYTAKWKAYKHMDMVMKADEALLFRLMQKHWRGWWD